MTGVGVLPTAVTQEEPASGTFPWDQRHDRLALTPEDQQAGAARRACSSVLGSQRRNYTAANP